MLYNKKSRLNQCTNAFILIHTYNVQTNEYKKKSEKKEKKREKITIYRHIR